MFFATSVLIAWRFDVWRKQHSLKNNSFLLMSVVLVCTSHLFSFLVVGTLGLVYFWEKLGKEKRWVFLLLALFGLLVVFLPVTRSLLVTFVYRMSNAAENIPDITMRGIGLGMLAKIPLTFYFFSLGERVYPLWWWFTLPAIGVFGVAVGFGVWRLAQLRNKIISILTCLMFLNVPFMYLVLDPIAPSGLQGAAPRYLIYVLPYWLFLLAVGAKAWSPIKPALILVNIVGLFCLAFPIWSFTGIDLVNWPQLLVDVAAESEQTCVITDGRSRDAVVRYLPVKAKIAYQGRPRDCVEFPRIVLVSSDHRLSMVRYFDEMAATLSEDYALISNRTHFPAQVTVYENRIVTSGTIVPGRLDLPEQDLVFPAKTNHSDWSIQGLMRLDKETPIVTVSVPENMERFSVLTNFRTESSVPNGTPVFRVEFVSSDKKVLDEIIVRSGIETAVWDGSCTDCQSVYRWLKRVHLLGTLSYSGAYRQYTANIWGFPLIQNRPEEKADSVTITFLLPNGVGYFYGLMP
jgi:hypothetical protein